jgi:ribonuclease BN (tRNA processing enzyme)
MLIDDTLAIDAGALTSTLSFDEQSAIRSVLLTHRHWDHVKDMPGFGFTVFSKIVAGLPVVPVEVYSALDVRDTLIAQTMSEGYWLNLFEVPDTDRPVFRHRLVTPGEEFAVGQYRICPIVAKHSVPTVGYEIHDAAGQVVYYTGDNGPGSADNWVKASPQVMITECTYSNAQRAIDSGDMFGHLCPSQLEVELGRYRAVKGYLPRVYVIHVNPIFEADIAREIGTVARNLGASVELATEGMRLRV